MVYAFWVKDRFMNTMIKKVYRGIRRWLWIFVLLPFVVVDLDPTVSYARQDGDILINVQAGYDGYFRPNNWTPIQVTVENNGDRDIQGTLQIRTQSSLIAQERTFQSPFFVRVGNARTEFVYVTLENNVSEFVVELLDNDGLVVETTTSSIDQIRNRDNLFVVITEAPELVLMTERNIGAGDNFQANWTIDDLPAEADALRSVDVIMFYDMRTGRLSVDQQAALANWVHGGGHLIVHGGAGTSWQFAQTYLADVLPTEPQGSTTVDSLEGLGRFVGFPSDALAANEEGQGYIVTSNTPKPNATVMLTIDNNPVIVRGVLGDGVVDFVAVDPLSSPLGDYEATNAIWFELMSSRPSRAGWAYDFNDWEAADDAIRIVTNLDFPSVVTMLLFLLIYIVLIGPVNYVILNLFNRREFAWFTIPVFIAIFTGIAYFSGVVLRGDTATVNHLSVVQAYPNSDVARVDGLVGIFSPRRTRYDITVSDNLTLRTLPGVESVDTQLGEIPIIEEANYRVDDLPVDAGIIATFATSGYTTAPNYSGQAVWTLTDNNSVGLSGDIRLAADMPPLEDAVVLAQNSFYPIGDITSGEAVSFDFTGQWTPIFVGPSQNLFGNRSDFSENYFIGQAPPSWNSPVYSSVNCAGSNSVTIAHVMYGQEYDCDARGGTDDERINRRRALLIKAISNESNFSVGRGGDIYVFGWANAGDAESNNFGVILEDKSQDDEFENLYVLKLPVRYETSELVNNHVLPSGLMTWTTIDTEGFNAERVPYNLRLGSQDEVTFRFAPVAPFQQAEVNRVDLQVLVNGSTRQVVVRLWNWETGQWVAFDIDNTQNITLTDPQAYLGPTNALHINLRANNTAPEVFVDIVEPTFSIS